MKAIIKKQICFEKFLYYFKNDKSVYNPADCHINTYLKFYDQNYEEVERREDDFKYVTGLMVCYHDNNKYCFVHSWIEDNGMIIDTTILANSQFKILNNFSIARVNEIKDILEKEYVIFHIMSCQINYLLYNAKNFTLIAGVIPIKFSKL